MILFKEVKNSSQDILTYAGYENKELFGTCKVYIEGEVAYLHELIVSESYRGKNLGEGLLRSILNKLDKLRVKRVIYNDYNSYLIKKGFIQDKKMIYVNLPEFFNVRCSSCSNGGENNEI